MAGVSSGVRARSTDRLEALAAELGGPDAAVPVRCDVTSGTDVDAAFAYVERQLGPVEVVVSNAGVNDDHLLLSMKDDAWSAVIDTNLTGAYRVAKRAVRPIATTQFRFGSACSSR